MPDFKCCLGGNSVNNPSTLRSLSYPGGKQLTPVAPLGLWELTLPMYYTPIAPLRLNAPNSLLRLTFCPDSSRSFNPAIVPIYRGEY